MSVAIGLCRKASILCGKYVWYNYVLIIQILEFQNYWFCMESERPEGLEMWWMLEFLSPSYFSYGLYQQVMS